MNQSLSMGDLLPSRHRRPHASKGRAAAQPQQQRGEDLLHGAHQLMKGMRAGAEVCTCGCVYVWWCELDVRVSQWMRESWCDPHIHPKHIHPQKQNSGPTSRPSGGPSSSRQPAPAGGAAATGKSTPRAPPPPPAAAAAAAPGGRRASPPPRSTSSSRSRAPAGCSCAPSTTPYGGSWSSWTASRARPRRCSRPPSSHKPTYGTSPRLSPPPRRSGARPRTWPGPSTWPPSTRCGWRWGRRPGPGPGLAGRWGMGRMSPVVRWGLGVGGLGEWAHLIFVFSIVHRPAHQPHRGLLHADALAAHPVSQRPLLACFPLQNTYLHTTLLQPTTHHKQGVPRAALPLAPLPLPLHLPHLPPPAPPPQGAPRSHGYVRESLKAGRSHDPLCNEQTHIHT